MNRILLILVAAFVASLVWVGMNLAHLVGLTVELMEWCKSLFELCLSYLMLVEVGAIWVATTIIVSGLIYASALALHRLIKGRMAIRKLDITECGSLLRVINDETLKVAFTYGFLRPRIYLSRGLIRGLSREELKAVVLHESHHRRMRDPLGLFIASFIVDALVYLPIGDYLKQRLKHLKELSADKAVVEKTRDPLTLAGALVKVAEAANSKSGLTVAQAASINGHSSIEARVRRLLGEKENVVLPGIKSVACSISVAIVLGISAMLPISTATLDGESCTIKHCKAHSHLKAIGEECKTHCERTPGS